MGFLQNLFGGRKKKVITLFQPTIDSLVAVPFEDQAALHERVNVVKSDVASSEPEDAELKVDALIRQSLAMRKEARSEESMLNVRKIYLALVALEDEYPAAFQACRDIEEYIQS